MLLLNYGLTLLFSAPSNFTQLQSTPAIGPIHPQIAQHLLPAQGINERVEQARLQLLLLEEQQRRDAERGKRPIAPARVT